MGDGAAQGIVAELRAHPPTRAQVDNYAQTGLLIAPDPATGRAEKDYLAWSQRVRRGPLVGSDIGAAFLDTTTLNSAIPLLLTRGRQLTPINLLDLCTIIDAVVMFDRVVCFSDEGAPIRALPELGSVFQEIEAPSGGDGNYVASAAFGGFWEEASSYFSDLRSSRTDVAAGEREALQRGWMNVLGISPELALSALHDRVEGAYAPYLASELSGLSETAADEAASIAGTVGASNVLGYVNEQISNIIGLPYLPNTARIPAVRAYRVFRGEQLARELAALNIVNEAYRERLEKSRLGTLRLPLLSAAVLSKNPSTPEELVHCIADIRDKSAKLRDYRREHARLLLQADEAATSRKAAKKADAASKKLRSAVEREGVRVSDLVGLSAVWGAVAGGALAFLTAPANHLILAASILLGAAPPVAERTTHIILERAFQPHLWLLTNLAVSAQALTDSRVRQALTTIWQIGDARADRLTRRLSQLSEARELL